MKNVYYFANVIIAITVMAIIGSVGSVYRCVICSHLHIVFILNYIESILAFQYMDTARERVLNNCHKIDGNNEINCNHISSSCAYISCEIC